MRELALHLLDIVENSVAANARSVQVSITEDLPNDCLTLSVRDDGKGMDAETAARAVDPFHTSRTTRKVGLGLPLLKAAAQACNGDLRLDSKVGVGTFIRVDFQRSHIDRMPLGDLPGTFLSMLVAHPEVNWCFTYSACLEAGTPPVEFILDDRPIKETLEGLPLTEPAVLAYLRSALTEGITEINQLLNNSQGVKNAYH